MGDIQFVDEIKLPTHYVAVLPFVDERIMLSQIYGRGFEFPADARQSAETVEEAAHRVLMEQCDASPLIMGVLALEEMDSDDSERITVAYYWAVVEQGLSTESMGYGAAKLFQEKQLSDFPQVKERKVLYDGALKYAKVVAEKLAKVKVS